MPPCACRWAPAKVETLYLMDEQGEAAFVEGGDVCVPSFVHGCVLRIEH